MKFRDNLLYTKNSEWLENLGEIVRIGIDDYSQKSLGDIVHVELCKSGTHLKTGESLGRIEATKSVSEIISPVSGVIAKVNDKVQDSPGIINLDPFGNGWLVEISPEKPEELNALMHVDEYKNFLHG